MRHRIYTYFQYIHTIREGWAEIDFIQLEIEEHLCQIPLTMPQCEVEGDVEETFID